jgi:hypothetical protein
MKPRFTASGTRRLELNYDEPLSFFAFKSNLRRYMKGNNPAGMVGRCRLPL